MEILLWLVPAAVATVVAMLVVGWVGRERYDVSRTERPAGDLHDAPPHLDESVSAARPMRRAPAPRSQARPAPRRTA